MNDDIIKMARKAIRLSADEASLTGFGQEQTILDRYEFLYWFARTAASPALACPVIDVAAEAVASKHLLGHCPLTS